MKKQGVQPVSKFCLVHGASHNFVIAPVFDGYSCVLVICTACGESRYYPKERPNAKANTVR